jgi:prepilin-type N-terminal cleavage/methylation domain-containing protein
VRTVPTIKLVKNSRRGLSLAEVMISLAISAMLLTAVAAAFSASSEAIETNDEFFRASQAARVSMNQILTEIRRCESVKVASTKTNLAMKAHDGKDRDYVYDAAARKLQLVTSDPMAPNYNLASNCSEASFAYDNPTGLQVVRVSVTVIVQVGKNQIRLTGSAAPRKAQNWN